MSLDPVALLPDHIKMELGHLLKKFDQVFNHDIEYHGTAGSISFSFFFLGGVSRLLAKLPELVKSLYLPGLQK